MDEKISLEAIAVYGDAYAAKISKNFFASKNKITGPEILSLCNVAQINLFIIRELMLTWREETNKLKSPYFDYEHEEVKDSLTNFMKVISNHISVDQENFSPLLKKAVRETLLVIFNPYDFFSILITGKNNTLELSRFQEEIKYLKINKAPLLRLVQKLEEKGAKKLTGNEAFAILDQILEEVNFAPEDLEEHIRQFSATLTLDPAGFYPAKDIQTTQDKNSIYPHKPEDGESAGIDGNLRMKEKNSNDQPTVNERTNSIQRAAVYNNFQKIAKIKDSLSINQKFMFTKVLFYGDFESFSKAVDDLDQLSTHDAALQYLEKQSMKWDRESREFHEFMEMVDKRFG